MKVLFICKGNWFRSQMAAAIYNKLTDSRDAVSAGTYAGSVEEPEGQLLADLFLDSPHFFRVMENNGLHVRQNITTKLLPEMIDEADMVVSMAEEPFVPEFLKNNKKVIWWDVANPDFALEDVVQKTYNKIFGLVKELVEDNKPSN